MKIIKNIVFSFFPVILFQCSFVCTHVYQRRRERSAYIVWNEIEGYNIVGDTHQDFVARGSFKNQINDTGWSFLEVETDPSVPDDIQAYAAGILEGYLTYDLIHMHWVNVMKDFCDEDRKEICKKIESYVEKNLNWITNTVRAYGDDDPYWHQVKLFYEQLNGLVVGVQNGTAGDVDPLGFKELLWMNIAGDLDDLVPALNASEEPLFLHGQRTVGSGSCSALIKLLPGNEDLYVAHDTWSSYQSMLRILKRYTLKYHLTSNSSKVVPGHTMTFSSYPGTIQSGDDFYLISSGLATVETTIGNSNNSLWKYINPLGQVLKLLRVAFDRRLIFTVGRSVTTGREDVITWNEIHHKTELGLSHNGHGYPDPLYLDNVLQELAAHGVYDSEEENNDAKRVHLIRKCASPYVYLCTLVYIWTSMLSHQFTL